jgi:anti-sigma regulatory factor (Ser/Thr protein kinase)
MRIEIPSDGEAPAVARSAARGFCEELGPSECATLLLLVSELVTNAVLHAGVPAGAPIGLAIGIEPRRVRVEITDTGSGFDGLARSPAGSDGGYGLYLVNKAASHWGHDRRDGMRVWFELAR